MSEMSEAEFTRRLASLGTIQFREDYEQALHDLFTSCSAQQRDAVRSAIRTGVIKTPARWRNPTDYERADLSPEQRVRRRLMGMAIHGMSENSDYRDDLMALAHTYHRAALLGLDADALLEDTAAMSPPDAAAFLLSFVRRRPEDKSLRAFGLRIVQTPSGPSVEFIP